MRGSLPPMTAPKTVFWSWQTDSPNSTNRKLIKRALTDALGDIGVETIDADRDDEIAVESATENVPGSPYIASTLFEKIDTAAVFVADVTIIGRVGGGARVTCNPNVLTELGYALSQLGFERVIMVCNSAFGRLESLPFDIRGRRVIPYDCPEDAEDEERTKSRKSLTRQLRTRLTESLPLDNPQQPRSWSRDSGTFRSATATMLDLFDVLQTPRASRFNGNRPIPESSSYDSVQPRH